MSSNNDDDDPLFDPPTQALNAIAFVFESAFRIDRGASPSPMDLAAAAVTAIESNGLVIRRRPKPRRKKTDDDDV